MHTHIDKWFSFSMPCSLRPSSASYFSNICTAEQETLLKHLLGFQLGRRLRGSGGDGASTSTLWLVARYQEQTDNPMTRCLTIKPATWRHFQRAEQTCMLFCFITVKVVNFLHVLSKQPFDAWVSEASKKTAAHGRVSAKAMSFNAARGSVTTANMFSRHFVLQRPAVAGTFQRTD